MEPWVRSKNLVVEQPISACIKIGEHIRYGGGAPKHSGSAVAQELERHSFKQPSIYHHMFFIHR
jgi:hypothetical protein